MLVGASGATVAAAQQAVSTQMPAFKGYVVDQAAILSPDLRRRLAERLGRFERRTRHQMAVVTVASLGGEDVAVYTRRLGNRWGVGWKGVNDGVVVLVAPNERKVRIAIGDGLTRTLPEAFCGEVIRKLMTPAFTTGRFDQGVEAGVVVLIARVDKVERKR